MFSTECVAAEGVFVAESPSACCVLTLFFILLYTCWSLFILYIKLFYIATKSKCYSCTAAMPTLTVIKQSEVSGAQNQ